MPETKGQGSVENNTNNQTDVGSLDVGAISKSADNVGSVALTPQIPNATPPNSTWVNNSGSYLFNTGSGIKFKTDFLVKDIQQTTKVLVNDNALDDINVFGDSSFLSAFSDNKVDYSPRIVPHDYAYVKLNNGDYVRRFETYIYGVDNADLLGQYQSTGEKWAHGLAKFGENTLLHILDGTVGLVYGAATAIKEGSLSAVFDNDFGNWVSRQITKNDYLLPNYYSNKERDLSLLSSLGTANFWADKFLGGVSYLTGALASTAIWEFVTGGAATPMLLGRFGFKSAAKSAIKTGTREAIEMGAKEGAKLAAKGLPKIAVTELDYAGKAIMRNPKAAWRAFANAAKWNKIGKAGRNAMFLFTSAGGEAVVEARSALEQQKNAFIEDYKRTLLREPTKDELDKFMSEATKKANYIFAANIPIVGLSNMVMFGKMFGVGINFGKGVNKFLGKLTGIGIEAEVDDAGKMIWKSVKRRWYNKAIGRALPVLEKPFSESMEEFAQGVVSSTYQKYLESRYNPSSIEKNVGLMDSFYYGLHESFLTKEGQEQGLIGGLLGFFGGGFNKTHGVSTPFGIGAYGAEVAHQQNMIERLNLNAEKFTVAHKSLLDKLVANNRLDAFLDAMDNADKDGNMTMANTNFDAALFAKLMLEHSEGLIDEGMDMFFKHLDLMDSAELAKSYGISVEQIERYKEAMKEYYKDAAADFKLAVGVADSMAIVLTQKEDGKTYNVDMTEPIAFNLFMGKRAFEYSKDLAQQLDMELGKGGKADLLRIYSLMGRRMRYRIRRVRELSKQKEELEQQLLVLQKSYSAELDNKTRRAENKENVKEIDKTQKKIDKIILDIEKKNAEIETLKEEINKYLKLGVPMFNGTVKGAETFDGRIVDIDELVNTLNEFEEHLALLSKENPNIANYIKYLSTEMEKAVSLAKTFNETFEGLAHKKTFGKIFLKYRGANTVLDDRLKKDKELADVNAWIDANGNISDEDAHTIRVLHKILRGSKLSQDFLSREYESTVSDDVLEKLRQNSLDDDTKQLIINELANKILNGNVLDENDIEAYNLLKKEVDRLVRRNKYLPKGFAPTKIDHTATFKRTGIESKLIQEIEDEIERLIARSTAIKELDLTKIDEKDIPTEEEYKEYVRLLGRKRLNKKEQKRLKELSDKINKWGSYEGVQYRGMAVADYLRMLISMRDAFKNRNKTKPITVRDLLEELDLQERDEGRNYNYIQSYETAMVRKFGNEYIISNISLLGFINSLGNVGYVLRNGKQVDDLNELQKKAKEGDIIGVGINGKEFSFRVGKNRNIVFSTKNRDVLHSVTPIRIMAVNTLPTSYQPVYFIGENDKVTPLYSDIKLNEPMSMPAIQRLKGGSVLRVKFDETEEWNKDLIDRYNRARSEKSKRKILDEIVKGALLKLYDKKGNLVGVMKYMNDTDNQNVGYQELYAKRVELLNKVFGVDIANELPDKLEVKKGKRVSLGNVKVGKWHIGHPNLLIEKDGDQLNVVYKSLDDKSSKKIIDVGFYKSGKVNTKIGVKGVSMYPFMTFVKESDIYKDKVVPFVVIEHEGKRVAYPVRVVGDTETALKEFDSIVKDRSMNRVDKIIAINNLFAKIGINPLNEGVNPSNFTREQIKFLRDKIEKRTVLKNVEDWVNNDSRDLDTILKNDVLINIDMSKPFVSPKFALLFESKPPKYNAKIDDSDLENPSKCKGC